MYWSIPALKAWSIGAKVAAVLVVVLSLVGVGFYLYKSGYDNGYSTASTKGQLELAKFKEQIQTLLDKQFQAQRSYEESVATKVAQIEKDKEDAITDSNRRYTALRDSVRNRPQRPADSHPSTGSNPATTPADSSGTSCTGGKLFREDGEFLAGEASKGDILRQALIACRARYDALKLQDEKKE